MLQIMTRPAVGQTSVETNVHCGLMQRRQPPRGESTILLGWKRLLLAGIFKEYPAESIVRRLYESVAAQRRSGHARQDFLVDGAFYQAVDPFASFGNDRRTVWADALESEHLSLHLLLQSFNFRRLGTSRSNRAPGLCCRMCSQIDGISAAVCRKLFSLCN